MPADSYLRERLRKESHGRESYSPVPACVGFGEVDRVLREGARHDRDSPHGATRTARGPTCSWAATPRASSWNSPGTAGAPSPTTTAAATRIWPSPWTTTRRPAPLHEEMGCICHVNEAMGLYFIEDPDGCWLEILPNKAEFAPQGGVDVLDAMARRRSLRRYSGEAGSAGAARPHLGGGAALGLGTRAPAVGAHRRARPRNAGSAWPNAANRGRPCSPAPTLPSSSWPTRLWPTPGWRTAPSSWRTCTWRRRPPGVGSCWIQGRLRQAADGRVHPGVRCQPPQSAGTLSAGGHSLPRHARSRGPAPPLR